MTASVVWLFVFVLAYWTYCIAWGVKGYISSRTASDYFIAGRAIPGDNLGAFEALRDLLVAGLQRDEDVVLPGGVGERLVEAVMAILVWIALNMPRSGRRATPFSP